MLIRFHCCILSLALLAVACDPFNSKGRHPSDVTLIQRFQKNEEAFNKLVRMSNEDPHVIRIAYDFTRLDTNWAWPRPDSQLGFSKERWDEYRALFKRLLLDSGISRETNVGSAVIFITASSKGMTLRGSSKGYAYSEQRLSPVFESLEDVPFDAQSRPQHGVAFKPIKEHWYLSYDW
jgi:hypothetical protein